MGSKRPHGEDSKDENCGCSSFNISGFYGRARPTLTSSRERDKITRIENKMKEIEERRLPSVYNPGVLGPPAIWKTFPRQAEAMKYSQLQGQGLMVFSFESNILGKDGKRSFVVAHPRLMWLRLLERNPNHRCSYEVIQEHSVCKLYFDLEFMYEYNPHKDGNSMVNTFIYIVCYFLKKEFGVDCTRKNIIDLDSSTAEKFSRHLIFNMPNKSFATNIHVGNFVIMICDKIRSSLVESTAEIPGVSREEVENLFIIRNSEKDSGLFCDEGVYTKNRNFRCLHCTKRGKNTPLVVARENQFEPEPKNGTGICKDEQFFIDSLVTTVDESCSVLTYGEDRSRVQRPSVRKQKDKSVLNGLSVGSSPYPEIDKHIESVVLPGYIRSWFCFSQQEVLVYEVGGNRFCHNIGREHKSNGVMYVVNLKTGDYYQKCHDAQCRDFRSCAWQLPETAIFWKQFDEEEIMEAAHSVIDFDESESDDELFVNAAIQAEMEDTMDIDEELLAQADKLEMWDKLDMLSSVGSSVHGSQSTHSSSQASNPWDRLSQLSTPDSSCFTAMSKICMSFKELSQGESSGACMIMTSNSNDAVGEVVGDDSDEEFVREAAQIEREVLSKDATTNLYEIEFNSCEF
ncbi:DNA-directed primase/polymerase protein-like [Palaemon carinicauda]|uniref:DNA-directed primase/polymerase protein-like n=1 Tax=Palaemon carinicauda TaxID=392227 RepID=UPI0035B5F7DA